MSYEPVSITSSGYPKNPMIEIFDDDLGDTLCPYCGGSGEGQKEGSWCWNCLGRGEISGQEDIDPFENDRRDEDER
jgi:hypothetical protein